MKAECQRRRQKGVLAKMVLATKVLAATVLATMVLATFMSSRMIFNLDDFGIKRGMAKKSVCQGLYGDDVICDYGKNWLQLHMFGFIFSANLFLEYGCHQQTWAMPSQ